MNKETSAGTWKRAGTGSPRLLWNLRFWPPVLSETKTLTPSQYWHVADQLRELASEREPTKCETLDIAPIEDFWELKDKGGPLGKINLRVFFMVEPDTKSIVVLGIYKKEEEHQLRKSVKVRISRRKRLYRRCKDAEPGGDKK